MAEARPKKRGGGKFGVKRSVSLSQEVADKIDKGSDRYSVTRGTLTREAIERGLDLVLESYRKQSRRLARKNQRTRK